METYSACYSACPRAGDSNLPVVSDGVAQERQGNPHAQALMGILSC